MTAAGILSAERESLAIDASLHLFAARLLDLCEQSLQIRPASADFTADFTAVRMATNASIQR